MPENGSGSTWGGRIPMATCRTRNPNATVPRRVPGASAGGERGSSAPPPIRRRGKEVEEKCPDRHSAPASRQRRLRTFERPGLPVQTGDAAPKWSVRRSATSAASASPPAGGGSERTAAPSGLHPPLGSCDNGRHALACWLPALSQGPAWPARPACPALSASMQMSFEMQVVGSEAPDPGPGGTGLKS